MKKISDTTVNKKLLECATGDGRDTFRITLDGQNVELHKREAGCWRKLFTMARSDFFEMAELIRDAFGGDL